MHPGNGVKATYTKVHQSLLERSQPFISRVQPLCIAESPRATFRCLAWLAHEHLNHQMHAMKLGKLFFNRICNLLAYFERNSFVPRLYIDL